MADQERSPRNLDKCLKRMQRKHESLLARLEQTAARLERRKQKLQALETSMAELERQRAEEVKHHRANGRSENGLMHARLIFNPSAGGEQQNNAQRLAEVVVSLRTHGIRAHIELKTSGRAARLLARDAVRDGDALVVVAAGDGTVEEVASELAGTQTGLGIVPIGTMNNLARSLGVPLDIDGACTLIGTRALRHIDVGRVTSEDSTRLQFFLEGAGVGLSAIAALAGQAGEKRHWGFFARALGRLFESKPGTIQVEMDGRLVETASRIVTVSNAPLMGANLLIAPGAKMDDGMLDVTLYDNMSDAALLAHFTAAAAGHPHQIESFRARHVRISIEEALPAHADKDVSPPRRAVEIEVVPRALSVIAGNGIALSLPVEVKPVAAASSPHVNGTNGVADAKHVRPELSEV